MLNNCNEEAVRERAYRLWEAGGRREGCDEYYWYLAVELLHEEAVFSEQMSETIAYLPEPGRPSISEDSGNDMLGPDALSEASCRQSKLAADQAGPPGQPHRKVAGKSAMRRLTGKKRAVA